MSALTRCPARVGSCASVRVDFTVHRSGDIGSPRTSGSTSANSADRSPGFRSATLLRPPPGHRRAPGSGTPQPSTTAAAARPDAGAIPRTSRRVGHESHPGCSYHTNEPQNGKQHLDSLQALSAVGSLHLTDRGDARAPGRNRRDQKPPALPLFISSDYETDARRLRRSPAPHPGGTTLKTLIISS